MLPESYIDADMRCVQPFCAERGRLGIAVDIWLEPTIRIALTPVAATFLRDCLSDYINCLAGTQSPGSELMPSAPVLVPSDGPKHMTARQIFDRASGVVVAAQRLVPPHWVKASIVRSANKHRPLGRFVSDQQGDFHV